MEKRDFLKKLCSALSGNVPPAKVRESLEFYSGYIDAEVAKGRTEKEVTDELGDARIIARTIIDTTPGAGEVEYEHVNILDFLGYGRTEDEESAEEDRQERFDRPYFHIEAGNLKARIIITACIVIPLLLICMLLVGLMRFAAAFPLLTLVIILLVWFHFR